MKTILVAFAAMTFTVSVIAQTAKPAAPASEPRKTEMKKEHAAAPAGAKETAPATKSQGMEHKSETAKTHQAAQATEKAPAKTAGKKAKVTPVRTTAKPAVQSK